MAAISPAAGFWLLLVLPTTIWVGVDASRRDWSRDKFATSTWQWVLGMLLLWIVALPVYLAKRGTAPLKSGEDLHLAEPATSSSPVPPPPPPVGGPPASWYPDPYGETRLRYWDGARWTEHTAE